MNYREDLEIKLQKVTLAMQEVLEDIYKTDQEKQRIIDKLIDFKEAIISKGNELNIELEAAQKYFKISLMFNNFQDNAINKESLFI